MNINSHEFDVSILVLTYQQDRLVKNALDSILAQRFHGSVEIIISDDASKDETQSVLLSMKAKLSEMHHTRLILRTTNLGSSLNFCESLRICRGRFIAYLEGDDHWLDPFHIQKCYDEISTSTDVSAVTAGYQRLDLKSGQKLDVHSCDMVTQFTSVSDLGYFPLTGASMWKSDILMQIPSGLYVHMIDEILWHYLFLAGKCLSLPHVALVYVMTGSGTHTGLSYGESLRSHVDRYEMLSKYDVSPSVMSGLEFWLRWALEEACERRDLDSVREYSQRLGKLSYSNDKVQMKTLIKFRIIAIFPKLYMYQKVIKHLISSKVNER